MYVRGAADTITVYTFQMQVSDLNADPPPHFPLSGLSICLQSHDALQDQIQYFLLSIFVFFYTDVLVLTVTLHHYSASPVW